MSENLPLLSINLVVNNGENFIRRSLDSVKKQDYPPELLEVNILDNNSTDQTREIIRQEFPEFNLMENSDNVGFWAGQEKLFPQNRGEFIIAMTDVILAPDFIKNSVKAFANNPAAGAIQAKIYKMEFGSRGEAEPVFTKTLDTLGFQVFKSRRGVNKAHGEKDRGQYEKTEEVFGVEGAVPIFRKTALEDCRIEGRVIDPDFRAGSLGYGDDFDLAWRMRLFGWKEILVPSVIAYHSRSTTQDTAKNWHDYFKRLGRRRQIPIQKRRLDWRNVRFTIIKNDYIINILKDLPQIILREIAVFAYSILFEPAVLLEIPVFLKLIPKMIRKRKAIMKKAKISPKEMRVWFQ